MMTTMLSSASILVSLIRSGAVTVTVLMVHIYAEWKEKKIKFGLGIVKNKAIYLVLR